MAKQIQEINQTLDFPCVPTVYASKDAELSRTIGLIRQYGHDMSPASFSMSVHNAIPGLLSVINKDSSPYSVIDSMNGALEMAVVEATTLLEQYHQVKVVYFEEQTTEVLQPIMFEKDIPMILVLLLKKGNGFTLKTEVRDDARYVNNTSNAELLDLLTMLQGDREKIELNYQRNHWIWAQN